MLYTQSSETNTIMQTCKHVPLWGKFALLLFSQCLPLLANLLFLIVEIHTLPPELGKLRI